MSKSTRTAFGGSTFRLWKWNVEDNQRASAGEAATTGAGLSDTAGGSTDTTCVPHPAEASQNSQVPNTVQDEKSENDITCDAPGGLTEERRNLETRPWAAPNRQKQTGAKPGNPATVNHGQAAAALARILASHEFKSVPQLRAFLDYIVTAQLDGRQREIKGYSIAVNALGRDASFDPVSDPIVRVEAARLRRRLAEYYSGTGATDPVSITVPKGSYLPVLSSRQPDTSETGALVFLQTRRPPPMDRPQTQALGNEPFTEDTDDAADAARPASGNDEFTVSGPPSQTAQTASVDNSDARLNGVAVEKRNGARAAQSFAIQPHMLAMICAGCIVLGFVLGRF